MNDSDPRLRDACGLRAARALVVLPDEDQVHITMQQILIRHELRRTSSQSRWTTSWAAHGRNGFCNNSLDFVMKREGGMLEYGRTRASHELATVVLLRAASHQVM